jgi:hypothetical protein
LWLAAGAGRRGQECDQRVPVPVVPGVPLVLLVPVVPSPVVPRPDEVVELVVPEPLVLRELPSMPLDVVPAVAELPLMSLLLVPVELQAARLRAIRAPITTPWYFFMIFSYVW